jgi:hypothetical protein
MSPPPITHWIGAWVDPRAGVKYTENCKFVTLPRLDPKLHCRSAHRQSLYRLRYSGSWWPILTRATYRKCSLYPLIEETRFELYLLQHTSNIFSTRKLVTILLFPDSSYLFHMNNSNIYIFNVIYCVQTGISLNCNAELCVLPVFRLVSCSACNSTWKIEAMLFLRNVYWFLTEHTKSHPRRQYYSYHCWENLNYYKFWYCFTRT